MFWKFLSKNKHKQAQAVKLNCPCCEHLTIEEPAGCFEICQFCYWEDDPIQSVEHTYSGGANGISLKHARQNYADFGASEYRFIDHVRKARSEEIPKIETPEENLSSY